MKNFRSIKSAEKYIEDHGWCPNYLKTRSGYKIFRTFDLYKEYCNNNNTELV